MQYFVYSIYNRVNDKIYIGQTGDINFRLKLHNQKLKGFTSRFTGSWEIIYCELCESRQFALKREKQLKVLEEESLLEV